LGTKAVTIDTTGKLERVRETGGALARDGIGF
jgi:hypothetical protein